MTSCTRCPVPSVAPVGVMVSRSADGLSMNVSWSPLTLSQARGFVDYVITYGPVGDTSKQSLTANGTYIVVTSLNTTASYSVMVSGQTSLGLGPSASVVSSTGR